LLKIASLKEAILNGNLRFNLSIPSIINIPAIAFCSARGKDARSLSILVLASRNATETVQMEDLSVLVLSKEVVMPLFFDIIEAPTGICE
jgi:hypothetical protein